MSRIPAPIARHQIGEFLGFSVAWLLGTVQFFTSGLIGHGGLSTLELSLIVVSGPVAILLFSWTVRIAHHMFKRTLRKEPNN